MVIGLFLAAGLWVADNIEYIQTANEQLLAGYEWKYVGKNKPSGVPAITILAENGEFILYKLKK